MARAFALLLLAAIAPCAPAAAIELPPACAKQASFEGTAMPLTELRQQVEKVGESDPMTAVRILCSTLPRAEREYGADSLEFAWWVQTLATPLIAYMDECA